LGDDVRYEHRGATSLGISGQDEIDTYIPVSPQEFENVLIRLKQIFGEPRSVYPNDRVWVNIFEEVKKGDIFLSNEEGDSWKNGVKFEAYLKSHPDALDQYRQLKEDGKGLSTREYYRRKVAFINNILSKE